MSEIAYLDASALVKLVVTEPESAALASAIQSQWPHAVASEVVAVEGHRAALRVGGDAAGLMTRRLRAVALLPLTAAIRRQAQDIGTPRLRALDAIHLASAVSVREQIGAVLTYDARLAAAARDAGLEVHAPA